MSTPAGPTPDQTQVLPEDPEAVVDEIAEPRGEDYDPADRIDPAREAAEADMVDQAIEAPVDDESDASPDAAADA